MKRNSLLRLFAEQSGAFNDRLVNFIKGKYDLMLNKLQFDNDLRTTNFQRPEEIVNFICAKLAQGGQGANIMVPQQVRRDLGADLTVRSDEEFMDLLKTNNDGLIKIFQGVRGDLTKVGTKREFVENHSEIIIDFYGEEIVDRRILDLIWAHLMSMRCPHLCPWCGMPCCGIAECNDKYVQGEVPCEDEVAAPQLKHSCQFHRDETITGVSNGESSTLPNLGDCPNLIRQDQKRRDWDPEQRKFVEVPYTYYDTTWRIRGPQDDREANHGLFWKWFHAHVSSNCPYEKMIITKKIIKNLV